MSIFQIKKLFFNNKKIIENFSYLTILQVFNMVLPIITYPYLITVLGAELYGVVVYSQVIISYFSFIVNFGFETSATKDISINSSDKDKLSEIISSVFIIKAILWISSLLILMVLIYSIPAFYENKELYLITFSLTLNELLFPVWYFQGTEKMKFITVINVSIKLLFLILIFIFIKTKEDYLLVPLFHGIGAFLGGVFALYILFVRDKIKFKLQPLSNLKKYMKDSLPIFSSNIVISIKDRFSIIIIGSTLGMREVAIFDLGIKIMNIFLQVITIANNSIFPKVSREKNLSFVKKFAKYSFLIVTVGILLCQPFLKTILDFLSNNMEGTLSICRILLISPVIFSLSVPLSRNFLITFGYYRYFFYSVIFTSLSYLVFISIAYMTGTINNILVFAWITVLTYLCEFAYRVYIYNRLINYGNI